MERGRIEPTISLNGGIDWNEMPDKIDRRPERPLLLGIVAFLLSASGIGMAVVLTGSWSEFSTIGVEIGMGTEWPYLLAVLAAVSLLSGLLLVSGEPLGWYLAMLVLANSFLAALQGMLTAHAYGVPVSLLDGDGLSWYVKYGARALLSLLLIVYFFTGRVRRFCSLTLLAGLICVTVCAVLGIIAIVV